MKKTVLLLLTLIFALLLCACDQSGTDADTKAPADGTSSAPVQQSVPLSIVSGGKTNYRVVRPDTCAQAVTNAAVGIRQTIIDRCGVEKIEITSDFEKAGTDPATRPAYEILVGQTNREESTAPLSPPPPTQPRPANTKLPSSVSAAA